MPSLGPTDTSRESTDLTTMSTLTFGRDE